MDKVIIREVKKEDIKIVFELGKNISGFEVSNDIVTFWPIQLLNNSVEKEDVIFLVMEQEKNIIGFLIMNLNYSLLKGEIEDIYILEEERNKGYGSTLLKKSIDIAKNKGINYKIQYINTMTNSAEGFFQKNDFVKGNIFIWYSLALTDIFKK
ncbi:MAG: GNAT family N-acetyltransferase [Bacilli bacterium]|nr:GNAT family N-acetyltransferase [Bacilli bacterium]MDD4407354.1 GNAT family N-acetyltransferase [Bacilli bacterium]